MISVLVLWDFLEQPSCVLPAFASRQPMLYWDPLPNNSDHTVRDSDDHIRALLYSHPKP